MKNKRLTFMSVGLLLLVAGCGSNATVGSVDPELLKDAVNTLKPIEVENEKKALPDYYNYINEVNEVRGDNYLSGESKQEILPTGGYEINDNLPDVLDEIPSYAKVIMPGSKSSSEEDIVYKPQDFASKQGRYRLKLEYSIPTTFASAPLIQVKINGALPFIEAETMTLPLLYEDNVQYDANGKKIFLETQYDDQMSPNQKRYEKFQNEGLYDSTFFTSEPLVFDITGSEPEITITNLSDSLFYIGKLTLEPVVESVSYNQYYASNPSSKGTDSLELNSIDYTYKNTNSATLANEQAPSVLPYEDGRKLLNVTSGWESSGQSMSWEFNVNSAGYYPLTLHYYNGNDNFPIYRKIEINGKVPFKEVEDYSFPTTGTGYKNQTICDEDGNPYLFYLKEGKNTITLTATCEELNEVYHNLMDIYNHINDFAIEIRKITGASIDTNKDYKLTKYFPKTLSELKAYKVIIQDSQYKIRQFIGNDKASASSSYFQRMNELIDELIEEPDDLPLKLSKFSSGDSCLSKLIADTANSLRTSPMILDTIYVTDDESKIREENASWTSSFHSSMVTLGQTFTSDKYKTILNEGELNIWSARSQAYNDILQTFADDEFTEKTGIKVNIRQMPSEDNLIYAYAANTVPDLVLGINSGRAFEFALRGDAAFPLSDFDETWKYTNNNPWGFTPYYWDVVENMPHGQLMSMIYNDKFYSLPESTSVQLMFQRDDTMNVMGDHGGVLPTPTTWHEVRGILPRLQAAGMNFYYPTSASGSLKGLASTAQFILQNNGKLLTDDAYGANIRDDATYEGLKLLTDFYTIYSLPTEVASFYNHFRYNTYPLGIGDLGMYLQLKYVAPELLGKWSVHQIPGIEQEPQADGTYKDLNGDGVGDEISRWFISNGSAAMIFQNSQMKDEAWLFLQWWMSKDIQEKFTESLQSAFGPSVVWFSSNLEAAKTLPIDATIRDVVLEQVKWIIDLQQIPGQYMLERGLSDIWNQVVFGTSSSGESTGRLTIGEAIDLEKVLMDREIQRKMEEFGYYDTIKGEGTRQYILRDFDWVEGCIKNHGCAI